MHYPPIPSYSTTPLLPTPHTVLVCVPSWSAIIQRWNNYNFHDMRCTQQVHHLVMCQCTGRDLADLHQSAASSQSALRCEAVWLNLGYQAVQVDVEAKLSQGVPSQGELHGLETGKQLLYRNQGMAAHILHC